MAYVYAVEDERITMPMPLASVDPSGNIEQKGQVTFSVVNLSSYIQSAGAIVTNDDLGLSVIYGAMALEMELSLHSLTCVPSATGDQIAIVATIAASGVELAADQDVGEIAIIAWGEIGGTTDNVL